MMVNVKHFYIDFDNDEYSKDLKDAYNYSVKNNCVVIIYSNLTGGYPAIMINQKHFSYAILLKKTIIFDKIEKVILDIKNNNSDIQYDWFTI